MPRDDHTQEHIEPTPDNLGANDYIEQSNGKRIRKKANRVQQSLRVQQVVTWLMEGVPYGEIVKRGQEKWGLSARPVERYIQQAREQVEATAASEIKAATTLAVYRLMELYEQAMKDKEYKVALDVIKTQNRMLGLNAPDKIETRDVEGWDSMELAEQFEAVEKKLRAASQRVKDRLPN